MKFTMFGRKISTAVVLLAACVAMVAVIAGSAQAACQWKASENANNKAEKAVKDGNYNQAIAHANEAIKISPNNPMLYVTRGSAYLEKNDFDNAIADFSKIMNLDIGIECVPEEYINNYETPKDAQKAYKVATMLMAHVGRMQAYAQKGKAMSLSGNMDVLGAKRLTALMEQSQVAIMMLRDEMPESKSDIAKKEEEKREKEEKRVREEAERAEREEQERIAKEEAERVRQEQEERIAKEEAKRFWQEAERTRQAAEAERKAKEEEAKKIEALKTMFTDKRDGKTYKKVTIGKQVWMAENLNFAAKGSVCYEGNCAKYGRLYKWRTAKKVCPAGFRLPSDKEWTTLTDYVGGENVAGTKLKSTSGWGEDGNGTDDYGFSALPCGYGKSNGHFYDVGEVGYWWSKTTSDFLQDRAYHWGVGNRSAVGSGEGSKEESFRSVRCVQNK